MKINWDNLLGRILGLAFAVVLVKMFLAEDDGWWEIVVQVVKGMVGI